MSKVPVSNSAYVDWNSCHRKYFNAYVLRLESRRKGKALAIGIIGHDAMQAYYKSRRDGGSHTDSVREANQLLTTYLYDRTDEFGMDHIMTVKRIHDAYYDFYGDDPNWEVLEVEKFYKLDLTDEFYMPMRLDLLIREISTNRIYIVDTKYTYDFWAPNDKSLSPQFPKYLATLKANGIKVDGVIINQLRYRENAKQLFDRDKIPITDNKIRLNLTMHVTSAREIQNFHAQPPYVQEQIATRVLKAQTCKYCSFNDLCELELDGSDTETFKLGKYQQKSYGYKDSDFDEQAAIK